MQWKTVVSAVVCPGRGLKGSWDIRRGPPQECLSPQFPEPCRVGESGHERPGEEPSEIAADPRPSAEVDERSSTDSPIGAGNLVPPGGVRRAGIEKSAAKHVDLVLERQLRLLASEQWGHDGLEGDFRDTVDLPVDRDVGFDPAGRRPTSRVCFGHVDLPVLLHAGGGRDDSRVRALPVVHPRLAGLVRPHPQQDRGREMLPHVRLPTGRCRVHLIPVFLARRQVSGRGTRRRGRTCHGTGRSRRGPSQGR